MGCPGKHEHGGDFQGMGVFCIPAPMAAFGAIIAFMCGAMMGVMMARKQHMMMRGGMMGGPMIGGGMMMGKGMPWKRAGMHGHHHHGYGGPPCTCMQEQEESTGEGEAAESEK
jgi:hypothetical protein